MVDFQSCMRNPWTCAGYSMLWQKDGDTPADIALQ
jgi:hypothetical protein